MSLNAKMLFVAVVMTSFLCWGLSIANPALSFGESVFASVAIMFLLTFIPPWLGVGILLTGYFFLELAILTGQWAIHLWKSARPVRGTPPAPHS